MNLLIKNGRVLINGRFHETSIVVKDGRIASFGDQTHPYSEEELDAGGLRIVPGFIDIHTHGAVGVDINHADVNDLDKVSRFFASQGTTGWLASLVADTEENTLRCIQSISQAMENTLSGAELLGIHLEGPFLAPEYKGAMAEHLLIKADTALFRSYQTAADGKIKYLTVSPEVEGVPGLIKDIRELGAVIALGHSGADYDTAMACIKEGAASSTHTFNGMKWMHQHAPAVSGAVLESDVYCEAICDGRHLHPGIVRLLLKIKGLDRVIAVTDSMMAAGLSDGRYVIGANDVEVLDGDARLTGSGMRAGSTLTMIQALNNLIRFTGKEVEELIPLLTSNPASLLGINDRKGAIDLGMDADFVLLDKDLHVNKTLVGGKVVFAAPVERSALV